MNISKTLSNIKSAANTNMHKAALKLSRCSPELLIAAGVLSIVGGTILACSATLKAEQIMDEYDEDVTIIEMAEERREKKGANYSHDDATKDKLIARGKVIGKYIRLYGPAVACISVGIACILGAHGIMRKRNAALMAAYNAVDMAFKQYRERVVHEQGELMDRHYLTGAEYKEVENPETGEKEIVEEVDSKKVSPSMYAKFFDESSCYWKKDAFMNMTFLRCVQNNLNDKLRHNGVVFLNELYNALDIDPTPAGQLVGWVKGDGVYIDLGIYDLYNDAKRRFVNGLERSILIEPNVQGIVYDKL